MHTPVSSVHDVIYIILQEVTVHLLFDKRSKELNAFSSQDIMFDQEVRRTRRFQTSRVKAGKRE